MDLAQYDRKKIAKFSTPLFLFFIFIVALLLYDFKVSKVLEFFVFLAVGIVILLPLLLVPIGNLFLLISVDKFHTFIGELIGITGDFTTLSLVWFLAITYIVLHYILIIATILGILLFRYSEQYEGYVFRRISPFLKKQPEETHQK